jgi:hypothetical protein
MNAVINRIMSKTERIGPNLRTPGAKLVLAQEITAAIPAHCNESVSVTTTIAALPSRRKFKGSPHRGRKCFVHAFVGDLHGNPNESSQQSFWSRYSLLLPAPAEISVNADQT